MWGCRNGEGDYKLIIEQLCSFSFSSDQKGNREKPQTCFIPYKEVREMDSAPPVPAGGGTPEAGSNGGGTEWQPEPAGESFCHCLSFYFVRLNPFSAPSNVNIILVSKPLTVRKQPSKGWRWKVPGVGPKNLLSPNFSSAVSCYQARFTWSWDVSVLFLSGCAEQQGLHALACAVKAQIERNAPLACCLLRSACV